MKNKKKNFMASVSLLIGIIAFASPSFGAFSGAEGDSCANGAGKITIIGGKARCYSNINLNWYNAIAWCKALGSRLPTIYEICGIKNVASAIPGNCASANKEIDRWTWTSSNVNATVAYGINLNNGNVSINYRTINNGGAALCWE